jgi:hypothetical protein
LKIKRHNKIYPLLLVLLLVSAGFLLSTHIAFAADGTWGKLGAFLAHPFNGILAIILKFEGILLAIAIKLLDVMTDSGFVTTMLKDPAILTTWGLVRDLLNMFIIMILLFSAFATVFQYSKYNYKSILMWLVIMTLLVNFSYPITLFIIDFSNSLMYTTLQYTFKDSPSVSMMTTPGSPFAGITNYIKTVDGDSDISTMLMLMIFIFIVAITILAIGIILLIRTIALAILLILSPIGFIGKIVNKDGGWWDHLFKYAMAGPIIAFVLLLSMRLMSATFEVSSVTVATEKVEVSGTQFIIPIVILWMGIGMAIKGIDGAGAVMGKAQGLMKGAGKKFSGYNKAKKNFDGYLAARKKRSDEMDKKTWGSEFGNNRNDKQDKAAGLKGDKKAKDRYNKRKGEKNKEDIKNASEAHEGTSTSQLYDDIHSMDITTMDDKQKKESAGEIKQAISRGDYEKQIEDKETEKYNNTHHLNYDQRILPGMSPAEIKAEELRVKKLIDARDKHIKQQKKAHMDKARNIIKEAEKIDTI